MLLLPPAKFRLALRKLPPYIIRSHWIVTYYIGREYTNVSIEYEGNISTFRGRSNYLCYHKLTQYR